MTAIKHTDIPQQQQRQDSTLDQLRDLATWANRLGMYDAYDWLVTCVPQVAASENGSKKADPS